MKNRKIPQREPVVIRNLVDIKQAIAQLSETGEKTPDIQISMASDSESPGMSTVNVTVPVGGSTMLRKLLIDGFEMVKRQSLVHTLKSDGDYGGFNPARPPKDDQRLMWIDTFVRQHLGGRRDGLTVVWDIPEGHYIYDPWSGTLVRGNV